MTHISFLRHGKFFGPEDVSDATLNIIGVGATGSWVGLIAAKMGWHNFQVWDSDVVESHNCPNQIYDLSQVGMKKVDAFEEVLKRFNPNVSIKKHDCFFTSDEHSDMLEDALFIAVDSLSARKDIVSCIDDNFFLDIVAETKMGFSHAELNLIDPSDETSIENYLSTLKNDDEVTESACNERIITTLTSIVASNVVHNLCTFYSSPRTGNEVKLPSKTIFNFNPDSTLTTYNL
jgi:hypothetical protein